MSESELDKQDGFNEFEANIDIQNALEDSEIQYGNNDFPVALEDDEPSYSDDILSDYSTDISNDDHTSDLTEPTLTQDMKPQYGNQNKELLEEPKGNSKEEVVVGKKIRYFSFGVCISCIVSIMLWLCFLQEPLLNSLKDFCHVRGIYRVRSLYHLLNPITLLKDPKSLINSFYYIVYLLYTIIAFIIPYIITKASNSFINTEKAGRRFLKDNYSENEIDNKVSPIWKAYKNTFFDKNFGLDSKTRATADLYFNYESVIGTMCKWPWTQTFRNIAGSFMGLGILGTFLGFSIGLGNIDFTTTNSQAMVKSVETLVKNGLSTAFNTSIVGVFLSLLYNFLIFNTLIKKFSDNFEKLSDSLDKDFYVSETEALMQYTMVTGEDNNTTTFSQSLKLILSNMNDQTKALNQFNNDLASEISNINTTVTTSMKIIGEEAGGKLSEVVTQNIQSELGGLKTSLKDITDDLIEVSNKLDNTPSLLETANTNLETMLNTCKAKTDEIINTTIETIKEELTDKFQGFENSLKNACENAKEAADKLSEIPNKINESSESFGKASSSLQEVSKEVLKDYESIKDNLRESAKDIQNAKDQIADIFSEAKLNESETIGKLGDVISRTNDMIGETNTILKGFKDVDANLNSIFKSISDQIITYNKTVNDNLNNYLTSFQEGASGFGNSVNGVLAELKGSIDNLENFLTSLNSTTEALKEPMESMNKALNKVPELQ